MSRYNTTDPPQQDQALVTAAEWFGGGQRIPTTRNLRAC